ncbi:MAG TPA: ATP-binding protein [Gemmatimonadales bacterium]|nr:ATP-binding protein [Gemmatimonadales bacterium]
MDDALKPLSHGFDADAWVPDRRARWAGRVAGWMLLLLGATGALGLLPGLQFLKQPVTGFSPLSLVTGLSLCALGAGLVALVSGKRTAGAVGAAGAVLVGALAVTQYLVGVDLGINPVAGGGAATIGLSSSVRVSIASAMLLGLAGAGLLTLASPISPHRGRLFAGGFGCVVVAFALGILLTTGIWNLEQQAGLLAGSSVQTLIGSLIGGSCLVFIAWSADPAAARTAYWLPVSVGAGCLVTAIFLWRALIIYEDDRVRGQATIAARTARREIYGQVQTGTRLLGRIARFSSPPRPQSFNWLNSMVAITRDIDGLLAIAWTDSTSKVTYIAPPTSDADTLRSQLQRGLEAALGGVPPSSWHSATMYFGIGAEGQTFAAAVPVCAPAGCSGYVLGVFDAAGLLEPVLDNPGEGYAFTILTSRGASLLTSREPPAGARNLMDRSSFKLGDLNWQLQVGATRETLQRLRSKLPDLLLLAGLLVTALLPLTVRLAQMTWSRARLVERVRLNLALETATDGIWEWDVPSGAAIRSATLWRHLGYGPIEFPAKIDSWMSLIYPDDRAAVQAAMAAHLAGKTESFEAEYRIRDHLGGWHWVIDRGRVVERAPSGVPLRVLGISADVTERKRTDEALEASERRFRACFDSAYQLQKLLDLEGRVLEANRTALDFSRTTIEQLRGVPLWDTEIWVNSPASREALRAAFVEACKGKTVRQEMELDAGEGYHAIIDFSLTPIMDTEGRVVQLLAEGRDVTASRQAEDQLREVESLSTMGRLAARVAHEINNPLAGIQNSFLLIKDAVPENHPHHSYVGAIEREISRIAGVTRQLYETYRPDTDGARETSIPNVVGDAVALLGQVNRDSKVTIKVDLQRAPQVVQLPDALLRQALYNLVQNAVEASPKGGTVWVTAAGEDGMFELRVKDNGPGIPQEIRERIFEPFFTTKPSSTRTGGMGLGLSLVRRSVHALGGQVEIIDVPEGGTEFVVRLPLGTRHAGAIS